MVFVSLSEYDDYLFHEGTHCRCYQFFGAHLYKQDGIEGTIFTLWAPHAQKVNIVGDFNDWVGDKSPMLKINPCGIWQKFMPNTKIYDNYKYEIITSMGDRLLKADPYGFYSEYRPATASKVFYLDNYIWQDKVWQNEQSKKKFYQEPLNIYEVHLGSWKQKNGKFLSYTELADQLISYVKNMGYTHLEIMPITEHPYDGSWGYQSTGYFSVTSRYGTPNDFKYLIDKCHQSKIGVILDWVPGHFCKDEHGLSCFDGMPLYESELKLRQENKEWGTANFDFSKGEVCSFLLSNAYFWFKEFHIDGLRVDAVAHLLYLNYGRENGQFIPNEYGGKENIDAINFLKKLNQIIFRDFPYALMIAEDSTTWPMVTKPIHLNGLGFNFKWNMGWMNDMLKYMRMDSIYRKFNHQMITFSFMYAFSENFILPLSHDEVVCGKKSLLSKMPGDYWQKFANLRTLYAYMIAHPGKKLLFMGGEIGQFIEWQYEHSLDWHLLEYEMHQKLHHYVHDLNHFYLENPSLWQLDQNWNGFSWIDHQDFCQSIITFMRRGINKDDFLIIVCNFTPVYKENYVIGVPSTGIYQEVFNTDIDEYGGSGQKNAATMLAQEIPWHNQAFSLEIKIPPLGTLFFKKIGEKKFKEG